MAHEVDYVLYGDDMQFVEIALDQGEAVVAEAGGMMYMEQGIQMETTFGDGSNQSAKSGFMGKLASAGKRVITGESLFMTIFENKDQLQRKVAFAAPYPGKIIALDLKEYNGKIICQKDAFLCAAKGTTIGIAFQKKIGVGFFGGEGFIMQKLEGDGLSFMHAGGCIIKKDLKAGEALRVDTGCLVALTSSIEYDIQFVGGIKNTIFGGEGLFFATVAGPGTVWLQSLPFNRMADKVLAASKVGGSSKEEGSVLGVFGSLLDGK
ncbi:MAG: TIGR00266 family protein [Firmicutes bacterium HGW-Firmicutes-7]|nr:MAG: TIGR00266 family protein [Firmicutes bacterium HGW-Firmicutes-7]